MLKIPKEKIELEVFSLYLFNLLTKDAFFLEAIGLAFRNWD